MITTKSMGRKPFTSRWQKKISISLGTYLHTRTECNSNSSIVGSLQNTQVRSRTMLHSAIAPSYADASKDILITTSVSQVSLLMGLTCWTPRNTYERPLESQSCISHCKTCCIGSRWRTTPHFSSNSVRAHQERSKQ
jgi:hypothetical protein